jgi:uncharacterized protein (DUF305 family)
MKNQSILVVAALGIFVALAIYYSLNSFMGVGIHKNMNNQDNVPSGMHRMPDGSLMGNPNTPVSPTKNDMGMMGGMDHTMMMVKSEQEFLLGMIPHHQEAVDTAKEVIARGGSTPEIKKLAEAIVVAQEVEITMMKDWYQAWYKEAYVEKTGAYKPMMRELSGLSGAALDKVFLEDMIMHHEGALMMAMSVKPYIKNKEITELTKAIAETQSAEILLMKRLLSEL